MATKGLAILMTIFNQSRADIFVMDWERFEQMKMVEVVDSRPQAQAAPAAGAANPNGDANANAN